MTEETPVVAVIDDDLSVRESIQGLLETAALGIGTAPGRSKVPAHTNNGINPCAGAASLAIVNPLAAFSLRGAQKWFSTHPPTAERVKRLEEMAHRGILPR